MADIHTIASREDNVAKFNNPLNVEYTRFDKHEIPDHSLRELLNDQGRAFRGIAAIGRILQASEVEKDAQQAEGSLTAVLEMGLYDALIFLADHGDSLTEKYGIKASKLATKDGAA
jgi:hypothetical protein